MSDRVDNELFENEVRRIARQLWPYAQYAGATVDEGRERDGVFETEDCVHLLEATVSRTKAKAVDDIKKLVSLAHRQQKANPNKAVKCWFVTKDEPTADQRDVAKAHHHLVNALSFSQFQSKVIDAAAYLSARDQYPFGSVRDPASGQLDPKIKYIPTGLLNRARDTTWSVTDAKAALSKGGRIVVLGDYGAGKSMTLRELYRDLRKDYLAGNSTRFPVLLNLRDHVGQPTAAEVLERHARNIGFANPSHLVRAWRAGYVILLLDGFDEVATSGIQGLWRQLNDARYRAMRVVRDFARDHPHDCGLALAGRAHFFNSESERARALGLTDSAIDLTLNEFSDEQIQRYLKDGGLTGTVPSWMPSRPLLVGYLAASGLLREIVADAASGKQPMDPAAGWDLILDRVCQRESDIEAGIDGPTVRRILERLATYARSTQSGLGPLSTEQIMTAFSEICGYLPDEKALVLLQRLPGLGIDRIDESTRAFLDADWADSCMVGDVVAYLDDPFSFNARVFRGSEIGLGALGVAVAHIRSEKRGFNCGKINAALDRAHEFAEVTVLSLDLANIAIEMGCPISNPISFQDIQIPKLVLSADMVDCSKLHFSNCYFENLEIDSDVKAASLPRFYSCYFGEIDGRATGNDMPAGVFDDKCVFEKFASVTDTVNAITSMELPLSVRVLLTMLRKLYIQSVSGRKENALHRGLDHHARRLVTPLLRMLQAEGLVIPYKRGGWETAVWVPDRGQIERVRKLVASPHTSDDPLLPQVNRLS